MRRALSGKGGHVLGVDGGGTGTRCVVATVTGRILSRGTSGPSNPLTAGVKQAAGAIMEAADAASLRAGVKRFRAAVMGVAGTERTAARNSLLERLPRRLGKVKIVSDAASALAGATGCGPGLIVIAGTGSIAYGVNEEGVAARAGGWGWRVGDEGSGYDLGRRAIMAALRSLDGRAPQTELIQMLVSELKLSEIDGIVDWAYSEKRQPRDFAALSPLVSRAHLEGDASATEILTEAGEELGSAAVAVMRRLGMRGSFRVARQGGVFDLAGPHRTSFEEVVRREAPRCIFIQPIFGPDVGSALLALKELGIAIDGHLLAEVESSVRELGE